MEHLSIRIKNDLSELSRVSQIANDFSEPHQLPPQVAHTLDLALHEIISNIISYGYDDENKHEIDIHISLTDGQAILEVEDDARPFNPLDIDEADTESSINDRPIGGLGVHLVQNLMDEIKYVYKNGKNCLIMRKKIEEP